MRQVWGDVGGWFPVESSDDSTREGGREMAEKEHTGRGEWPPKLTDVFPGEGRTAEMPRGGVPVESGDEDENAGALLAPACPQHCSDSGGREILPPTVRPV